MVARMSAAAAATPIAAKAFSLPGMIVVKLAARELAVCRPRAKSSTLAGRSSVYANKEERERARAENQLVAQFGNLALCKHLFGQMEGHVAYQRVRHLADLDPTRGDEGEDVFGLRVDVKATRVRSRSKHYLDYNLLVRPREFHSGVSYVLALVETYIGAHLDVDAEPDMAAWTHATCFLMGWHTAEELPSQPTAAQAAELPFGDARAVVARKLHPLMPLPYHF
jgi:hypothetical protein